MGHTVADAVIKSMAKHLRKPSDAYPTPPEGTQSIVNLFPLMGIKPGAVIGEPCCGRGDLALVLEANGYKVKASDIRDTGYGDPFVDFLTIDPRTDDEPYDVDAIVTNPPFTLADDFINHAVNVLECPIVILLLKTNFFNSRRGLRIYNRAPHSGIYPLTFRLAFLEEERGSSPLMDCSWFVWQRDNPRKCSRPLIRPPYVPETHYPESVLLKDNEIQRTGNSMLRDKLLESMFEG